MIILGLVYSQLSAHPRCKIKFISHNAPGPAHAAAHNDGVLRMTATGSPPCLAISGEIDEATYPALVQGLARLAGAAEIHLGLGGVEYCDLAGLRAIIALADTSGGARRVVLHEVPPWMRTVLGIVGWDSTPGLVIDETPARPPPA
jgi:anti-anti-sigma regulatory factor